jgi:hypothetical protein
MKKYTLRAEPSAGFIQSHIVKPKGELLRMARTKDSDSYRYRLAATRPCRRITCRVCRREHVAGAALN